jgi:hypothetical protein
MFIWTRPYTALAALLPVFLIVGFVVGRDPDRNLRTLLKTYWPALLLAALIALLQPLYLYHITGSPFTNLYTLIWPYDRIGFGPGIGVREDGHTLAQGVYTAALDLGVWASDLFGWPSSSWIAVVAGSVFGVYETRRGEKFWPVLLASIHVSLVVFHLAYWVGGTVLGARYYYEAHAGMMILGAVGLRGAARYAGRGVARLLKRETSTSLAAHLLRGAYPPAYLLLAALIAVNAAFYLPGRLAELHGLYGITRAPLDTLKQAALSDRVLVLVRGQRWIEYAVFFSLNSPWVDDPVIAAHDLNPALAASVIAVYPDREVWYWNDGKLTKEPTSYETP